MSNFTSPLVLMYLPKNNLWRTERELIYHVGDKNSDDVITVPKYFITDLASVPWPAVMLIPKSGRGNSACVIHDFLYHLLGKKTEPYNMKDRTRAESDRIFLEAMKVLGVNVFKRRIMYRAVRVGGWAPWNSHAKRKK